MDRARDILKTIFGYSEFRHNQAAAIAALLNGQDVLTLMPTGGGKSLCYQIPALIRGGAGIVVSPLIALMQDQVNALNQLGIRAAFLNSTLDHRGRQETEQALLEGALDLLYVAPERLLTERMLNLLDRTHVALFAIDEAHCVSQWGHDFRREYQQLSVLHERYPRVPRVALTATADQRTRAEIIDQLQLQQADVFLSSFDRPNIHYSIHEGQQPREQLWRFIQKQHPNDAGIIYCLSRKKVESTARWLNAKGREALPYHAGLTDQMRRGHQERFLREDGLIIVATIAFGMGIDKPDVRFVAHLNLPKSIEAYYQETGRAGRDGAPANAWLAYGLQDIITLRQMVQGTDAEEQFKRIAHHKLEALLGLCDLTTCRREALLAYFGESTSESCGNCDNCLSPPQTWDGSQAAQKAISCVYRTGQRFGVNYVIDVLTGKDDERIRRNGHNRLSTYDIGGELSGVEWRSVFRQLIALGYLEVDVEGHGALRLDQKCRSLLRGELGLQLRRQRKSEKPAPQKTAEPIELRPIDEPLFDALRARRLELAGEQGVPPYVIFHDSTLREMAKVRPDGLQQMHPIAGVGEHKLALYGDVFLEVIRAHPLPALLDNDLTDTVNETLFLHLQGKDVETIAQERGLKSATIYVHFSTAIETGLLKASEVLSLDQDEYRKIVKALEMSNAREEGRLTPVYETLDKAYDYGILRCVLAGL